MFTFGMFTFFELTNIHKKLYFQLKHLTVLTCYIIMKLRLRTQNMTVVSFCEEIGNTDELLKN